jgi:hypothetical protein
MPTLSSTIVKHQIASMRDVEEALARQVLYGGDLATNLLELAAVSERALTGVLAESHELEPGPIGELPAAAETTRRLVPGDIALRHGFYPLEERGGVLVVAVSEPLVPEVEEDLAFALGVRIVQRAVPLVRIRQALARDYTVPLDRRTLRILAKLEGLPDPSPSVAPGPVRSSVAIPALPRPPSVPPFGPEPFFAVPPREPVVAPAAATAPSDVTAATTLVPAPETKAPETKASAPAPADATHLPAPSAELKASAPETRNSPAASLIPASRALRNLARAESRPPKSRPRRHGPYTAAMAESDLMQATSRDDVLRAFFDFALQYFEYSALFAVHGDLAEGRDSSGPGADRARVNGIGVPLDLPSALASARQEVKWQLLRLSSDGLDASLAKDLERPVGRIVLLLPIVVRERCVLILYGDHGSNDVELSTIGELIAFAPLVSVSLERVIVKRKLMARGEESSPTAANAFAARAGRSKAPKPDLKERALALARALDLNRPSARPPAPTQVLPTPVTTPSTAPAPITQPIPDQQKAPITTASPTARPRVTTERLQRPRTQPLLQPPPKPSTISRPTAAEAEATASALQRAVVAAHPVISVGGEPRKDTPAQGTPTSINDETAPIPLTRRSNPANLAVGEPPEDGWRAVGGPTSAKPISRKQTLVGGSERLKDETAPIDSSPEIAIGTATLDADIDELLRASEVPPLPSSRSIVHHSHRLRPRRSSDEMRLPTVIVDLASDCRELVRRLLSGDNEAGEKLVEIGAPAVSELVAAFPGPITRELRRGAEGPPRASECGPLLRVLARIGPDAAPFLIVRTADTDPKVRAWATRLLGELPTVEGARAVAKRLADTDTDVRRAALAAGRMMQADPETRGALREDLSEAAAAVGQPSEVRQAALEAISDLRDPRVVPRLIRLVNEKDAAISKSAHWALVTITRQDFARDAVRWTAWWEQNANNHRIEWLIDSLMHEDAEIRRAAGDELKALTKEYFGYYDDLPRKERARAQSRYREWWETKGKARFSKQSIL